MSFDEKMIVDTKSETEVLSGTISLQSIYKESNAINRIQFDDKQLEEKLQNVNDALEKYTNNADQWDYAFAVASGIISGVFDSLFVGEFSLEKAHEWGSDKTEKFVLKIAKTQGYQGDNVDKAIVHLAEKANHNNQGLKRGFHLASDSNTMEFGGAMQHHLRDFSHHASITGWVFSMLTQFTKKVYGTDTSGVFKCFPVGDDTFIGEDIPQKFLFGTVYWFFHLVSDVAGSGNPDSEGTGIPGPLLSAAKLLASTPLYSKKIDAKGNREFSVFISKLFNGTFFAKRDENGRIIEKLRFDFRTELGVVHHIGKMTLPVIINETLVRAFYFIRRLVDEINSKAISSFAEMDRIDWDKTKPSGNRTIDRMLTISSMTFTVADTADAAVHAAIESGGNWVLFAGKFVTRFNYVGAGRAAIAVVKEISNEKKEAQLIHEKLILTEAKTMLVMKQLQEYKAALEERVSNYLAEDIQAFMEGFDYMDQGFASNDSDLIIKGNVVIQRVLGREPQFTTQEEFDDLMDSDIPLKL